MVEIEGWLDGWMAEANRQPRPNQIQRARKSDFMCMLVTFCWQRQPEVQVLTALSVDRWRRHTASKERERAIGGERERGRLSKDKGGHGDWLLNSFANSWVRCYRMGGVAVYEIRPFPHTFCHTHTHTHTQLLPPAGGQSLSFACCRNFYRNSISTISVLFYFVLVETACVAWPYWNNKFLTWEGYSPTQSRALTSPMK